MSGVAEEKRWYLLACLHCRPLLIMPFGAHGERGQWASAHRHGTGHNNWFATQVRSRTPAAIEDPVDKIAACLFGSTPQGRTA